MHQARLHDQEGAKLLLASVAGEFPGISKLWADSAYQGIRSWLRRVPGWELEVVRHWWSTRRWVRVPKDEEPPPLEIPEGFQVLPRRWVVERTLAWLCRNRRLSRDYEFLPETEEAFIYLAMSRLMLRRLDKSA